MKGEAIHMERKALVITPEGHLTLVTINSFKDIQKYVGGTFTPAITDFTRFTVFVHDEGILKQLEPNLLASRLVGGILVGPAVVMGPVTSDGDTLDVTDEIKRFLEALSTKCFGIIHA